MSANVARMDSTEPERCETTAVIIVGAGPTGALLSAILGHMSIPNIVLEREGDITTDPRGIALDEDGIRLIQSIGMYDRVYGRIAQCQNMRFVPGTASNLMTPPFLGMDLTSSDGGTGHVHVIFHRQPELERAIRDAIQLTPCSELRSNALLTSITEDESHVTVEYTDQSGSINRLRAPFLVGADGKTGYVRKRYLEAKGILMERCEGTNYDETWVALNWQMRLPTPESHPNFPLWAIGYTPEQVYDLFFPQDFRFLCNPSRPSVCGRFGPPSDRLWRFEFVVLDGEDGNHMACREQASKIIIPYITHPGSQYGLDSPVSYPEDCITILRSRPFHFSARSCNKWALGRVIVAGDAAHVFPPFGGQGIASGFRDASALAWRLAHLYREPNADYEKVLRAWYTERKQQFDRSLAATIRNGEFVTNASPWKAFIRDWGLWVLQLSPYVKHTLERGARNDGMIKYKAAPGLPFIGELGGGLNIPQVYARDLVSQKLFFTDDLIFSSSGKGLFQLLILVDDVKHAKRALEQIQGLAERSEGRVREDEATVLIHDLNIEHVDHEFPAGVKIARIASGDEFAEDPALCRNRPAPRFYDPFRIRNEVRRRAIFIVLRPDRFVFAACSTIDELWMSIAKLKELLFIPYSQRESARL